MERGIHLKRLLSLPIIIISIIVLLTGCLSSSPSNTKTKDDSVFGLPRSSTFVFASVNDFQSLEPQRTNKHLDSSVVHKHINDVLAWRDTEGNVTPRLAKEWKQIDPLTWEFTLRDDVYFHDGTQMTSEDVKFTFERAYTPEFNQNYQLPFQVNLDEVKIVDDFKFQLITKTPSVSMEFWLFESPIISKKYYGSKSIEEVAEKPMGAGPYKFVEWVKGDHLILKANDKYWGGKPPIENIVFRVIPEEGARLNELKAGKIDFAEQISVDVMEEANTDISHADIKEGLRKMLLSISIEKGNPALKDKRVRQALNYAINKEAIIKNILGGTTSAIESYVNPPNNNPDLKPYSYDPDKAKSLLKEAGYEKGLSLTIVSPPNRYGLDKEITMQMAEDLKAVGVDAKVDFLESGIFFDRLDNKELTDLIWIGWAALVNPVIENLILTTGHVDNSATYSNPEFDKLYEKLSSTIDPEERNKINKEMQKIVWDDAPWIFLWKLPQVNGVSNRVKWDIRNDGYFDLNNAEIIKQ